jgi:ribosome-associated protein
MELSIARSTKRPGKSQPGKPKPGKSPKAKPIDVDRLLGLVEASLDDDQAEDINTLTLRGKSSMADYMVIATGRNARQIAAMADHLATKLKAAGAATVHVEGLRTCDWVLIDCGDIIVHLFRPEIRSFYNLEKMWGIDMPGDLPGDRPTTSRVRA